MIVTNYGLGKIQIKMDKITLGKPTRIMCKIRDQLQ